MEGGFNKSCSWTETGAAVTTVGDQRQQIAAGWLRYSENQQVHQLLETEGLKKLKQNKETGRQEDVR